MAPSRRVIQPALLCLAVTIGCERSNRAPQAPAVSNAAPANTERHSASAPVVNDTIAAPPDCERRSASAWAGTKPTFQHGSSRIEATAQPPWPCTVSDTVTKPVLIAVIAIPQQDVDADTTAALSAITDDFYTYLPEIDDSLSAMGVEFKTAYTTTVRLLIDSTWTRWTFPRGRVGYLLAAPGHRPIQVMDVDTADHLIPSMRAYLRGS